MTPGRNNQSPGTRPQPFLPRPPRRYLQAELRVYHRAEVVGRNRVGGNEPIMAFIDDEDVVTLLLQFKHHDDLAFVVTHELNSDGTWSQFRKDIPTESKVLLGLHCADAIRAAFGLDGNDELLSGVADADVQFVRFDLPDIGDGGPQMALQ